MPFMMARGVKKLSFSGPVDLVNHGIIKFYLVCKFEMKTANYQSSSLIKNFFIKLVLRVFFGRYLTVNISRMLDCYLTVILRSK